MAVSFGVGGDREVLGDFINNIAKLCCPVSSASIGGKIVATYCRATLCRIFNRQKSIRFSLSKRAVQSYL
ncbi:MAG: hypothetical protein PHP70_06175 [Gallionella sp.]|nr:hypothetical protein [Gallionella sp.]